MIRRLLSTLAVTGALTLSTSALPTAASADTAPPASSWLPRDTVVAIELSRPKEVLDLALSPNTIKSVKSLPAYQQATSRPGFLMFQGLLTLLESRLGTDWKVGLRQLLAGGATLALNPDGTACLIIEAENRKILESLHEFVLGITKAEAVKAGRTKDFTPREYRGVRTWSLADKEAHAIVGNRLLVANKKEALQAMLDRRAQPSATSLASEAHYQASRRASGSKAAASVFVNMAALNRNPSVRQALTQNQNPIGTLLFAAVLESLRNSNWLSLALDVNGDSLSLNARANGQPASKSGVSRFACAAAPEEGALPNISVPRRIAGISFYRDLHDFYAAKDDLFPERTSGLIFFENMMGIFFSGMDLTEEVLAEIEPEIRFVVARQKYDPAIGTPRVQIPAFAAILRLKRPCEFAEIVEEAWQKAVGLINFTRGQQAMPGLIIDRLMRGETKYTVAYFRAPKEKTNIDSRFNFRPALARADEFLILSSTGGLAADLIDALTGKSAAGTAAVKKTDSLLEIDGAELSSLLTANRDNFVRQNMVEKGNTRAQAAAEVGILLGLSKLIAQVKLSHGTHDGQPRLHLELKLESAMNRT